MLHSLRGFLATALLFTAAAAVLLPAAACRQSTATANAPAAVTADTWAVVDGRQISRDDVERAYRRAGDPSATLAEEEVLAAKLSILDDLILQDILLARARTLNLEIPASELDAAYASAKNNLPDDAFNQELTKRRLSAEDMREGLRRQLLAQKVIEQEIGPRLAVSDREVNDFFSTNRARFNLAEESYHLAQIVVTPAREPQLANGTGDDAATPEAAAAKVKMLMERLKAGASFRELAAGYSEDPETAPRGGDLGLIPMSQIRQVSAELQKAVVGKSPGSVNVVSSGGIYTLVLVVAHEPAGQRDLSTPGVKERITETLRGRKEQLFRTAYLARVRSEAEVENHFAKRIVEGSSPSLPGLAPSAPPR